MSSSPLPSDSCSRPGLLPVLTFSGALLSAYLLGVKLLGLPCFGGGCAQVLHSSHGVLAGIPVSAYALAAWLMLPLLGGNLRRLLAWGMALGSVYFIGVQFYLGSFCGFCLAHAAVCLVLPFVVRRPQAVHGAVLLQFGRLAFPMAGMAAGAVAAWLNATHPQSVVGSRTLAELAPDPASAREHWRQATASALPVLASGTLDDRVLILSLDCPHCFVLFEEAGVSTAKPGSAAAPVLFQTTPSSREVARLVIGAALAGKAESFAQNFATVLALFPPGDRDALLFNLTDKVRERIATAGLLDETRQKQAAGLVSGQAAALDYLPHPGTPSLLVSGVPLFPFSVADAIRPGGNPAEGEDKSRTADAAEWPAPDAIPLAVVTDPAPLQAPAGPALPPRPAAFQSLIAEARNSGQPVSVLLDLDLPEVQSDEQKRAEIQNVQRTILERIGRGREFDPTVRRTPKGTKFMTNVPVMAMRVGADELVRLEKEKLVLQIMRDELHEPLLFNATPHIGADGLASSPAPGFTGTGVAVAILDTGVDREHDFFKTSNGALSRVIAEYCFSTGNPAIGAESLCPGGNDITANTPGAAAPPSGLSSATHGTHVAGIAAGRTVVENDIAFHGVARNADIIGIQVFTKFTTDDVCGAGASPCLRTYSSDYVAALDHLYGIRASLTGSNGQPATLAAVNMSLGGGKYTSYCDSQQAAIKTVIDNLRSAGIATLVATGNSGYRDGISSPSCISTAVSVASTVSTNQGSLQADAISGFSNIAPMLSLYAPGQLVYSSIPGGGYASMQGTSMAAPVACGAWALLKQAKPSANVDEILAAFQSTGVGVEAPPAAGNAAFIRKRIDVQEAAFSLLGSNYVPVAYDDVHTVSRNGQIEMDVLANDTDRDGDAISVHAIFAANLAASLTTGNSLTPDKPLYLRIGNGESVTINGTTYNSTGTGGVDARNGLAINSGNGTVSATTLTESSTLGYTQIPNGTAIITPDRKKILFTPEVGWAGTTTFTYQCTDDKTAEGFLGISSPGVAGRRGLVTVRTALDQTTEHTAASGPVNMTIPDNQCNPVSGALIYTDSPPIEVSGFAANQIISSLEVTVNIDHSWAKDLDISLVAPNNSVRRLVTRPDHDYEAYTNNPTNPRVVNLVNATFSDSATAQFDRNLAPEGARNTSFAPVDPLYGLAFLSPNGNWKLRINDAMGNDIGTLVSWSLKFRIGNQTSIPPSLVTIEKTGDSTAVEEGGSGDSVRVRLLSAPASSVTVTLSDPAGEVIVSPGTVEFSPANWMLAQAVNLGAVEDGIAEGAHQTTLQAATSSTDTNFNGQSESHTVFLTDSAPGFVFAQSDGFTQVMEGGEGDTYTVRLATIPSGSVTLSPAGFPVGQITVSPSSLVFHAGNWNQPQTVTLGAIEDSTSEGAMQGAVRHAVTASDDPGQYPVSMDVPEVPASVVDNEVAPGITATPASLALAEGGVRKSYTLRLNAAPTGSVTVSLVAQNLQVAVENEAGNPLAALTFTTTNWNTPQSVYLRAIDDSVFEGTHQETVLHGFSGGDPFYAALSPVAVSVSISDNETPGTFAFSAASYEGTEGASLQIPVVRTGGSGGAVTVNYKIGAAGDTAKPGTDYQAGTLGSLTWTDGETTAQTIDVEFPDNAIYNPANSQFTIELTTITGATPGSPATAAVTVLDNDQKPRLHTQRFSAPDGTIQSFNLVNKALVFTPDGLGGYTEHVYDISALPHPDFASQHTAIPHAADPDENDKSTRIELTGGRTFPFFNKSHSHLNLGANGYITFEPGAGDTSYEPGTPVHFNRERIAMFFRDLDPTAGSASVYYAQLGDRVVVTFHDVPTWGESDFNTFQGELFFDGRIRISYTRATLTTETTYVGISPGIVPAPNPFYSTRFLEECAARILFAESGGSTNLDESIPGTAETYSVSLVWQPASDVTVTLQPDAQALLNGSPAPAQLTFTTSNWNTPQEVTLTVQDDAVEENVWHRGFVRHSSDSADPAFDALSLPCVVPLILDNDAAPGVRILPTGSGTAVSESGSTDTYSIALASPPAGNVTVTATPDSQLKVNGSASPHAVHFTSSTWNLPQIVTVSAVDDSTGENSPHFGTISHSLSASADPVNYPAGMPIAPVTALITDNDFYGEAAFVANVTVMENAGTATIVIARTGGAFGAVSVDYATVADMTATAVSDFTMTSGTLNWADGDSATKTVTVPITNDAIREELPKKFHVVLSSPQGGILLGARMRITVTIEDDDMDWLTERFSSFDSIGNQIVRPWDLNNTQITFKPHGGTYKVFKSAATDFPVDDSAHTSSGFTASDQKATYLLEDGKTFVFFGQRYSSLRLSSAGAVSFLPNNHSPFGADDSYGKQYWYYPCAAFYLHQLDPGRGGTVRAAQLADRVVFTFRNVQEIAGYGNDAINVQCELFFDGTIRYTYLNCAFTPMSDTRGLYPILGLNRGYGTALETFDSAWNDSMPVGYAHSDFSAYGALPAGSLAIVETGGSTSVAEEGSTTDTFTLALQSAPALAVSVSVSTDSQLEMVGPGTPMLFTPENWSTPQTVTVRAVDDADEEGLHTGRVSFAVETADADYIGIPLADILVAIGDNDDATPPGDVSGFQLTASDGAISGTWTPPADTDFAGVLVLVSNEPVAATPAQWTEYSNGESLGNASVLYSGSAASFNQTGLTNGQSYHYKIFACDTSRNYSSGVAASAVPGNTAGFQQGINGYTGTRDTHLRYNTDAGNNYGVTTTMRVRSGQAAGLVAWDLSSIPQNAVVRAVYITLTSANTGTNVVNLHRALRPWVEGTLNGTVPNAGAGATWNSPNGDGANLWTTAGAGGSGTDFGTSVLGSFTMNGTAGTSFTVELNQDGKECVAAWVANPAENHGLVLRSPTNALGTLYTEDATTANAAFRPKLTVVYTIPPATSFASWAGSNGLSGEASAATGDSDGDGVVNLLEYALNMSPLSGDSAHLPELSMESESLKLTYRRPSDRSDLTYTVRASTDLVTWTTEGVTQQSGGTDADGTPLVTATKPLGASTRLFLRLEVSR